MSVEITSAALFALIGLSIVTAALLYAWQGWLTLKAREIDALRQSDHAPDHEPSPAGARIELADLKERIRRLEAIASGVEL